MEFKIGNFVANKKDESEESDIIFEFVEKQKVLIIAVGNGGSEVLVEIRERQKEIFKNNIKYLLINTDRAFVRRNRNDIDFIWVGRNTAKGLGARSDVETAKKCFLEGEEIIDNYFRKELKNIDLVFVLSSFGGGTGTGITSLITQKIKRLNFPTICFIGMPNVFEGEKRNQKAKEGLLDIYKNSGADKVILFDYKSMYQRSIGVRNNFNSFNIQTAKIVEILYTLFLHKSVSNKINKEQFLEIILNKRIEFRYVEEFFVDIENEFDIKNVVEKILKSTNRKITFFGVRIKGYGPYIQANPIDEMINNTIKEIVNTDVVIQSYIESDDSMTKTVGITFILGEEK